MNDFSLPEHPLAGTASVKPPPPPAGNQTVQTVEGELSRMPTWSPFRIFATVTGLLLLRAVLVFVGRYLIALRGYGRLSFDGKVLQLSKEWTLLGRTIRRSVTVFPIRRVDAVKFENRQRYLYLLVGFGFLTVGTLVGAQWFLDGLRAGYPYLTLVGAGVVLIGILLDLALYLFFPFKKGNSYLLIASGPWLTRLRGVDAAAAKQFIAGIQREWEKYKR